MTGRQCPEKDCSPGYFKVRSGTGITENHTVAYCPYCCKAADPSDFATGEQVRYLRDIAQKEALDGVDRMIHNAFGLGASGRKKLLDGFISMELQYQPAGRHPVRRPIEEELRRDMRCATCGLEHGVFGLATWCPDCGRDIFLQHVEAEFGVVHKIVGDVPARRERLGARVAARDLENALEDLVSVFEAVLKNVTRRHLIAQGKTAAEAAEKMHKTIRTQYQNIAPAEAVFRDLTGRDLLAPLEQQDRDRFAGIFEKRHPITHNLGVIDRKYLDRALSSELEGREIRVISEEVSFAAEKAFVVLKHAYAAAS